MLNPAEPQWSQPEQFNMAQLSTSDLQDLDNLFEFGDIDLNIAEVDPATFPDHMAQPPQPHPTLDDSTEQSDMLEGVGQDFGGPDPFGVQTVDPPQQYIARDGGQVPKSLPYTTESIYQPSMQQHYVSSHPQQFRYPTQQHGFPPGHHVPPTPNSFEMHGETAHFMQQQQMDAQQRAILEQRYHVRKDDAIAFTPMVSPAGTPQYSLQPEYTVPGAYFSPLTSPMLHAQNGHNASQSQRQQTHQQSQGYYTNSSTGPSSNATSPMDQHAPDVDMTTDGISLPEPAGKKTARRKMATPKSMAANARLRSSPLQKGQKRKPGKLSTGAEGVVQEAQRSSRLRPEFDGLHMSSTFNLSSEDGSISPEPLSECLMPPPRRPTTGLTQSPLGAANLDDCTAGRPGPAATPNSILSLRNGQPSAPQAVQAPAEPGSLEDFQLPEAVESQRLPLPQLTTRIIPASSEDSTPRVSARKTPKLGPLSTPSSARPSSAMQSPSIMGSPMVGPLSVSTPIADAKGFRNNKKRASTGASGAMLSPALRPRISPSIKPLLPEGTPLHSPTHALLLASKSNYQNLLEGNHLPGVNYPDSLSTGLTSKRTSHKVAEQGRRNRINEALKEMQSLLPKVAGFKKEHSGSDDSPDVDAPPDADSKESKEEAAAKSNSSKAATVESANDYIRRLKREHAEKDASMAMLQRKMEALERRLHAPDASSEAAGSPAPG